MEVAAFTLCSDWNERQRQLRVRSRRFVNHKQALAVSPRQPLIGEVLHRSSHAF